MPTLEEAQAAYDRAREDRDAAVALCATLRRALEEANRVLERTAARFGEVQHAFGVAFKAERAKASEETK